MRRKYRLFSFAFLGDGESHCKINKFKSFLYESCNNLELSHELRGGHFRKGALRWVEGVYGITAINVGNETLDKVVCIFLLMPLRKA